MALGRTAAARPTVRKWVDYAHFHDMRTDCEPQRQRCISYLDSHRSLSSHSHPVRCLNIKSSPSTHPTWTCLRISFPTFPTFVLVQPILTDIPLDACAFDGIQHLPPRDWTLTLVAEDLATMREGTTAGRTNAAELPSKESIRSMVDGPVCDGSIIYWLSIWVLHYRSVVILSNQHCLRA